MRLRAGAGQTDAACTEHMHTRAGAGVAALACGLLLPVNQMSLVFYDRVDRNDYAFLMGDRGVQPARQGPRRQERDDHGATTACSPQAARTAKPSCTCTTWTRSARSQLDALATGRELQLPPHEVCKEETWRSMVIDGTPSTKWSGWFSSASSTARNLPAALDSSIRRGGRAKRGPCFRAMKATNRGDSEWARAGGAAMCCAACHHAVGWVSSRSRAIDTLHTRTMSFAGITAPRERCIRP